ncbi:uncharacterized protein Fot_37512 [Forsythia ovata]|uniref:Transmembrane protein n=1 Tax=Forsythia ovata TaxID=205694 RepID=A0ABD1RZ86_9LAMI
MAAKLVISSSLNPLSTKLFSPSFQPQPFFPSKNKKTQFRISANIGGGENELKKGGKKKFITKEEEPEQYWQTAGEREGENPMKTPLPYIIIFGMSTPFVILAIAFANGWIKVPVR